MLKCVRDLRRHVDAAGHLGSLGSKVFPNIESLGVTRLQTSRQAIVET